MGNKCLRKDIESQIYEQNNINKRRSDIGL